MFTIIQLVLILSGAMAIGYATQIRPRRALSKFLAGRRELTQQQFYDRFYASSGIPESSVLFLLGFIEKNLGAAAGKLRPTDSFSSDLFPGEMIVDSDLDYFWSATAVEFSELSEDEFPRMETVGDYIRILAPRVPRTLDRQSHHC